jgi:hypothetical protein
VTLWKPIPIDSIPKRFEACDEGTIRTLPYQSPSSKSGGEPFIRNMPGRILKARVNKQSPSLGKHPVVGIYIGTSREHCTHREFRVAKLVATAFHGVPFDPTDMRSIKRWKIRFRDGDFLNCAAVNLEWVYSAGENGTSGRNQSQYEKNLDGYNASRQVPAAAYLSRLFGEVYGTDQEENAA